MSATNEKRCEHGMPVGTDEACSYCQEPISPASAQCSAADFRIEQLTRALHIALRSITGTGTLAMNAKLIARHAIEHHGAKGDLWKLSPNDQRPGTEPRRGSAATNVK